MHSLEQLDEGSFALALWKFVTPVQIHNLAEQRDFFHAMRDQIAHFAYDLVNRTAAFHTARLRHNAKGAMHIASLDNGDKRRGLPRRQLLIANCRLRADFLCDIDDRKT